MTAACNREGEERESGDRLTVRGSEVSIVLEEVHGGEMSRKFVGDHTEDEEAAVVMGLLRLVLEVKEEEGVVALLLHRSAWRRDVHGVGAAGLVPVVAFGGEEKKEEGERDLGERVAVAEEEEGERG